MSTLQECIDLARNLLNEPLDTARVFPDNTSSFFSDSILTTYHNLIQQEVQQEIIQADEDYFVTQSYLNVVAGTAEYSLPSGFIKMRRVEDNRVTANPVEIYPVGLNQRGSNFPPSYTVNSAAFYNGSYYLRGNQIVLTDTPTYTNASAVRCHFIKSLADVTAATTTSELPAEHHRVLVWGIVKLALFQQQSDTTLADSQYERHLVRIRQEAENRQTQRPRRVATASTNQGG